MRKVWFIHLVIKIAWNDTWYKPFIAFNIAEIATKVMTDFNAFSHIYKNIFKNLFKPRF